MPTLKVVACRGLLPVFLPLIVAAELCPCRARIDADVARWGELATRWHAELRPSHGRRTWFVALLLRPEFRTLLYRRLRSSGMLWDALARVLAVVYRPQVSLYIDCPDLGPGLYIEHGFSTVVNAERIGRNCWINQQVTIGIGAEGRRPVLGDGVAVRAGAIVVGGVHLGDGCAVWAGAVVVRDVPPGVAVAGVPARVVTTVT